MKFHLEASVRLGHVTHGLLTNHNTPCSLSCPRFLESWKTKIHDKEKKKKNTAGLKKFQHRILLRKLNRTTEIVVLQVSRFFGTRRESGGKEDLEPETLNRGTYFVFVFVLRTVTHSGVFGGPVSLNPISWSLRSDFRNFCTIVEHVYTIVQRDNEGRNYTQRPSNSKFRIEIFRLSRGGDKTSLSRRFKILLPDCYKKSCSV